ncbi:Prolyl 4-hydroxylase [Mactra antiquata]
MRHLFIVGIFVCLPCIYAEELFSSVAKLQAKFQQLRNDETRLHLKRLITRQENILENIKRHAATLEELSGGEIRDPTFSVNHPINAFRFIRNHSVVFNTTVTEMLQEIRLYEKGRVKIHEMLNNVTKLDVSELKGTVRGIVLIQQIYNLSVTDMANGYFNKLKAEPLTAAECKDIMVWSLLDGYHDSAEAWYQMSLKKIEKENDLTITKRQLLLDAASASALIKDFKLVVKWYSKLVELDPRNRYHKYRLRNLRKRAYAQVDRLAKNNTIESTEEKKMFMDACQGKVPRLLGTIPKHLYCEFFTNGDHPYLMIQPARRELISQDPLMEKFHDIISKKTILNLRKKYVDKIERSRVVENHQVAPERISMNICSFAHPKRTSQTILIPAESEHAIRKIQTFIEAVTSLQKSSYESFLLSNYGVGGQFYCHHDYYKSDNTMDNRIAAFMLYMSDVESGGGTAFPEIQEVIFPEMGTGLLWYHLKPNLTVNPNSKHCGCPIVVGNKWKGIIQIRHFNNEFSKPCPLEKDAITWT